MTERVDWSERLDLVVTDAIKDRLPAMVSLFG